MHMPLYHQIDTVLLKNRFQPGGQWSPRLVAVEFAGIGRVHGAMQGQKYPRCRTTIDLGQIRLNTHNQHTNNTA
jgi:hypothetical protein